MDLEALHALLLQLEWGADEALDDSPVDRLAPARADGSEAPSPRPAAPRPAVPKPAAPPRSAQLPQPTDLESLRAAIQAFDGCALRETATGAVLAEGDPSAALMVIYGPPSADDDRARRPLSGAAGRFFDAMLASIGLERAGILLAPLIPWRPPGGRPPSPGELAQCLPFLHRLIALSQPRLVALMGTQAARAIIGPERRARGRVVQVEVPGVERVLSCLATADPEDLLRNPDRRPGAWADLRRLIRALRAHSPERE